MDLYLHECLSEREEIVCTKEEWVVVRDKVLEVAGMRIVRDEHFGALWILREVGRLDKKFGVGGGFNE